MRISRIALFILSAYLFIGCGSSKKVSENVKDKSHIVERIETKIDTSYFESYSDSLTSTYEVTVKEYEIYSTPDTIIPYLKKETTSRVDVSRDTKAEKASNSSFDEVKDTDRYNDIKIKNEEIREPYKADWIKYVFWTLLLAFIIYIFFFVKRRFFS